MLEVVPLLSGVQEVGAVLGRWLERQGRWIGAWIAPRLAQVLDQREGARLVPDEGFDYQEQDGLLLSGVAP